MTMLSLWIPTMARILWFEFEETNWQDGPQEKTAIDAADKKTFNPTGLKVNSDQVYKACSCQG